MAKLLGGLGIWVGGEGDRRIEREGRGDGRCSPRLGGSVTDGGGNPPGGCGGGGAAGTTRETPRSLTCCSGSLNPLHGKRERCGLLLFFSFFFFLRWAGIRSHCIRCFDYGPSKANISDIILFFSFLHTGEEGTRFRENKIDLLHPF